MIPLPCKTAILHAPAWKLRKFITKLVLNAISHGANTASSLVSAPNVRKLSNTSKVIIFVDAQTHTLCSKEFAMSVILTTVSNVSKMVCVHLARASW